MDYATVEYLDEALLVSKATARGCGKTDSLFDFCEEDEATIVRKFPTVAMAKRWAKKNADCDMHREPKVYAICEDEHGCIEIVDSWCFDQENEFYNTHH